MLKRQQGRQHPLQQHGWIPSKGLHPNERGAREVHHPQFYTAAGADSARFSNVGLKAYAQTSVAQKTHSKQAEWHFVPNLPQAPFPLVDQQTDADFRGRK